MVSDYEGIKKENPEFSNLWQMSDLHCWVDTCIMSEKQQRKFTLEENIDHKFQLDMLSWKCLLYLELFIGSASG